MISAQKLHRGGEYVESETYLNTEMFVKRFYEPANEVLGATLNLDYLNPEQKTLAILGKGNRFRLIELEPKTTHLLQLYINRFRLSPKPPYQQRLFVNQRGEELTRFGIYRLCRKYLAMAPPPKRLQVINPVHSLRHSCAVNMLATGKSAADVKNRLGHDNLQSTMTYLHLDLNLKRQIQKRYINYMQSVITLDSKVEVSCDANSGHE